jgi:hypothetical protein
MLEGLELLLAASAAPLPVLATQHRVIGSDACHFVAPATLSGNVDTPGKIFVTSERLIFAAGRVQSWPWHRVRRLARVERALLATVAGAGEDVQLVCNTYGDAMIAAALSSRARRRES